MLGLGEALHTMPPVRIRRRDTTSSVGSGTHCLNESEAWLVEGKEERYGCRPTIGWLGEGARRTNEMRRGNGK